MKISKEELSTYKTYVTYNEGYRIVYYYEKYHEAKEGYYARNIEDFASLLDNYKYTNNKDLLNKFLEINPSALGVAIYDINQNCIEKLVRENVSKINDSEVFKEELIYDYNYVVRDSGYRVVFFTDEEAYSIGCYCGSLETFMFDFAPYGPIDELCEIPPFVSVDDILTRYLNDLPKIKSVAIYEVNGKLIGRKDR